MLLKKCITLECAQLVIMPQKYGDSKKFDVCNNTQNRAMRYYLGVHRFAPIYGMQGDFGWLTPRFRRFKCILRFWNRLIDMTDDRLTKHVFLYDYVQTMNNWSTDIKELFHMLDLNDIFEIKSKCDIESASQKLHTICQNEW